MVPGELPLTAATHACDRCGASAAVVLGRCEIACPGCGDAMAVLPTPAGHPFRGDELAAVRAECASLREENARLRADLGAARAAQTALAVVDLPPFNARGLCRACGQVAYRVRLEPARAAAPAVAKAWWRGARPAVAARAPCIARSCDYCGATLLERLMEGSAP